MTESKNVDLVRLIYEAWERGDFSNTEWAHPEIEYVMPAGATGGTRTGLAGMVEAWRGWLGAWEDFRAGAEEYREIDDERVLVLNYFSGRGKTSGLEVGQTRTRGASLFHVRDAQVTRLILYADRERALADLGLADPSGG